MERSSEIHNHDAVQRAHERQAQRDWEGARAAWIQADAAVDLDGEQLEHWAQVSYLLAREEECCQQLERAHLAYLAEGRRTRAARSAFWLGLTLMFMGRGGPSMGWMSRTERILEASASDCVERGYLFLPLCHRSTHAGDHAAAYQHASAALAFGERFGDPDLSATSRNLQGRARLAQGMVDEGLALLDEAMVAVTAGEVSPRFSGLVYCSVIQGCQQVYALERARQWTEALTRWCDSQPSLLAFTGTCMVHRSEVLESLGEWSRSEEEAKQACERFMRAEDRRAQGAAWYRQGEILRLRGQLREAQEIFEKAGALGYDPQPGMALLRLAQGETQRAVAAIDRVLGGSKMPLERTESLAAAVEIHIAGGNLDAAEQYTQQLERTAGAMGTEVLEAIADHARGTLLLALQKHREALVVLQRAESVWQRSRTPYAQARTACAIGKVCRQLGDLDGGNLALHSALAAFERLGAAEDVRRIRSLFDDGPGNSCDLSPRELEVLRLVATGMTNKSIAGELGLSVKTIDRHLSNLFLKLNVSSRAEATACAFKKSLVQG